MTDNYYKALGLPTNSEIDYESHELYSRSLEDMDEERKRQHYKYGFKAARDLAASRIKEVACEFAEWEDSYLKEWNTNPKLTLREHEERLKMTTEQRFDLFIKERSGE